MRVFVSDFGYVKIYVNDTFLVYHFLLDVPYQLLIVRTAVIEMTITSYSYVDKYT